MRTTHKASKLGMEGSRLSQTEESAHAEEPHQDSARCFLRFERHIHKEFLPTGDTVNAEYYVGVLNRLLARIRKVRPQYWEQGSWSLLHDNAPVHKSRMVRQFVAKQGWSSITPYILQILLPATFGYFRN